MPIQILRLKSLKSNGIKDEDITIEALKSRGLQQLQLTGLPDVWLRDMREKIKSLVSCYVNWGPLDRILIHLLPAGVEKCGPHSELPIALASMGVLQENLPTESVLLLTENYFVGALNLRGDILPTLETQAWETRSHSRVIGPSRYSNIAELWQDILRGELQAAPSSKNEESLEQQSKNFWHPVNRSIEQYWIWLCYLARLPVLLLGPPGVGKSYRAKWAEQLLFFKNEEDENLVRRIWSLASLDIPNKPPVLVPLPRSHFAEFSGIQRQGVLRPGYFALSNKGMMVLDEFCEFSRDCREILRNILDEKKLLQNTKSGQVVWPTDFFLILTSNPCPCGMSRPGDNSNCKCAHGASRKYQSRISGPLYDRMGVRPFLKEQSESIGLPTQYIRIPQNLNEVRTTVRKVEENFEKSLKECLPQVQAHAQLKMLSQREQVNKAKILAVLEILTALPLKELISIVAKRSSDERIISQHHASGGHGCSPFGTVSSVRT